MSAAEAGARQGPDARPGAGRALAVAGGDPLGGSERAVPMRIVVVIRREDLRASAGVRIRYLRLQPALESLGHAVEIRTLDEMSRAERPEADAYILCKCHDVRAALLARSLGAAGRPVGIDVFDDHFSQRGDARLVHLRRWIDEMRPSLRFALCATPAMSVRLRRVLPGVPLHVMSDPAPALDAEAVAEAIERKAALAREARAIEFAWFGMGDNRYFPLGLQDLAAWGDALAEVRSAGFAPRLTILSNRRAFTPDRLEALARLPVPFRLEEWSLEAEAALLGRSLVAFLPVNAQPFSTAKSLNRAMTALVAGAQVLTSGYPLYRSLGSLTYRSGPALARDVLADRLRLRRETLPRLETILAGMGGTEVEARRIAAFLSDLHRAGPAGGDGDGRSDPPLWAVLHGVSSGLDGKAPDQLGPVLSVASVFEGTRGPTDVRLEAGDGGPGPRVLLSARAADLLAPDLRAGLGEPVKARGAFVRPLPLRGVLADHVLQSLLAGAGAPVLSARIALYPSTIGALRSLMGRLFPGVEVILSESASPFAEEPAGLAPACGEDRRTGGAGR